MSNDGPRRPQQSDTTRLIGSHASDEEKGDPPLFTPADRIFNAGCLFYVLLWIILSVLMPALITALAVFVPATRDGAFVGPFVESFEQLFGDPPPIYDLSSPPESLLLLAGFAATAGFLGMMYYFLPKHAERPIWSYRLSIVAFWAFTYSYIWARAAPSAFQRHTGVGTVTGGGDERHPAGALLSDNDQRHHDRQWRLEETANRSCAEIHRIVTSLLRPSHL